MNDKSGVNLSMFWQQSFQASILGEGRKRKGERLNLGQKTI